MRQHLPPAFLVTPGCVPARGPILWGTVEMRCHPTGTFREESIRPGLSGADRRGAGALSGVSGPGVTRVAGAAGAPCEVGLVFLPLSLALWLFAVEAQDEVLWGQLTPAGLSVWKSAPPAMGGHPEIVTRVTNQKSLRLGSLNLSLALWLKQAAFWKQADDPEEPGVGCGCPGHGAGSRGAARVGWRRGGPRARVTPMDHLPASPCTRGSLQARGHAVASELRSIEPLVAQSWGWGEVQLPCTEKAPSLQASWKWRRAR